MKKHLLTLITASLLAACSEQGNIEQTSSTVSAPALSQVQQSSLDQIASGLNVKYRLISNKPTEHCDPEKEGGHCFEAELVLTAGEAISVNDWQIFFSHITPIQKSINDEFEITHVNGDLHRVSLKPGFTGFEAGETKAVKFYGTFWTLSETDALPNYIVKADGLEPRVIESTKVLIDQDTGLEILPFVEERTSYEDHFKRTDKDQTKWLTAERLFERNEAATKFDNSVANQVIPTPNALLLAVDAPRVDITKGLNVKLSGVSEVDLAAALVRLESFGVKQSDDGLPVSINVVADETTPFGSYQLDINADAISVSAADKSGAFYALQTLASLVTLGDLTLPVARVEDGPHYEFRGLLVDVARNFRDKGFILKLLDQMSAYKLNKLHLHLGDDEGWRLEIPSLPELTEVGSKRCWDEKEQNCLMPQLGAGLDPTTEVNGYYSVEDYKEILAYASARHIQVIPSLDMPGHSRAAVKAMKLRYNKYSILEDKEKAEQFMLHEDADPTVYSSVQYYSDNTINVCLESSFEFVKQVMKDVQAIHNESNHPLTRYHIGADETAGAWVESPACKDFLANNEYGVTKAGDLGGYFVERISRMLADMGIETAAWSDGLSHTRAEQMPAVVQANAWSLLFWGGHSVAHDFANRNWHVVLSSPDVLYFDFPYEADPKEHGYYWAGRHVNTEKIFQFMPDNLPIHAEFWLNRQDLSYEANDTLQVDEAGKVTSQPLEKGKSFAGVQGQLWSENTRTNNTAEYKIYPRLFALAERGWHNADWAVPYNYDGAVYNQTTGIFTDKLKADRDLKWAGFAKTVGEKELAKLELANVHYRIPTVGAVIDNNTLKANVAYPNLAIEYRVDGGQWQLYREPTKVSGEVWVRARAINGKRFGRALKVTNKNQ